MTEWSKLCEWLEQEVADAQGGEIELAIKQNDAPPKRGIAVSAYTRNVVGEFCLWETGEADFDIMVGRKFVHHVWGLKLTKRSHLHEAFANFVRELANA